MRDHEERGGIALAEYKRWILVKSVSALNMIQSLSPRLYKALLKGSSNPLFYTVAILLVR